MSVHASLGARPRTSPAHPAGPRGCDPPAAAAVVLIAGAVGLGSDAAHRLLERALADSGLDAELSAEAPPAAPWRRRGAPPPRLVVAFGAEAASALLRRPVSLGLERGKIRATPDGGRLLVTEHPKEILRQSDPVARGREYRRLVNDLMLAVPHRRRLAA